MELPGEASIGRQAAVPRTFWLGKETAEGDIIESCKIAQQCRKESSS